MIRRQFALATALLGAAGLGHAQANWPDKPITVIVHFPPGGVAATVAQGLDRRWEQQRLGNRCDLGFVALLSALGPECGPVRRQKNTPVTISHFSALSLVIWAVKSLDSGVNMPMSTTLKPAFSKPGARPTCLFDSA